MFHNIYLQLLLRYYQMKYMKYKTYKEKWHCSLRQMSPTVSTGVGKDTIYAPKLLGIFSGFVSYAVAPLWTLFDAANHIVQCQNIKSKIK